MIRCDECDKEIISDSWWVRQELGTTNVFCSKECLDKWIVAKRGKEISGISLGYKKLDDE